MKRDLSDLIYRDLIDKMVFVTVPRQVGKTTLATDLGLRFRPPLHLNHDSATDRQRIAQADWASTHDDVILDEIHTMPD